MPNFGLKEFSLPWKGRVIGSGTGVTSVTASGDLTITGPAPTPNVETLFTQPLSGELYVNFSAPSGGIGSKLSPFNDLAPAVAMVATLPIGSLTRIWITLGNSPNGHESDSQTWAPGRLAILDCPVRTYPILGEMTLLGGDGNTTALLCRNATVSKLIYQDMPGIASSGVIIAVGENGTVDAGGIEQRDEFGAPGGLCFTLTQWAGMNNVGFESGGILNTAFIVGALGCTAAKADNVRFSNPVATARLELTQCALDASPLLLADKGEHNLQSCSFLASPFEIRADAGGQVVKVKMDLATWYNWLEARGFTSAAALGDGVNVYQHEFATNCGFEIEPVWPTDLGKIYRQSPSTPRVMLPAVGDAPDNANGITGAWQGDEDSVMPLTGPTMWVRLAGSLTLTGADPLYLDTASSCATNVPTPYPLGLVIWDPLGYAGTEAVCLAATSPAVVGLIPGPILPQVGPVASVDDWDFGLSSLADTDARFGTSLAMTVSGTQPERGDVWNAPGELRWRQVNGMLMLQVSDDGATYRPFEAALTGGATTPDSIALACGFDNSETIAVGGNAQVLVWSQTTAGTVDPDNQVRLQVARVSSAQTAISVVAIEASIPTVLVNDTFPSDLPFVNAVAIAIDGSGNLTTWAGQDLATMSRLNAPYLTSLALDRMAIEYVCNGTPNTSFKLLASRRQAYPTY